MHDLDAIRRNAELIVHVARERSGQPTFGYDRNSIAWVDNYVERLRAVTPQERLEKVALPLACYLGECLVKSAGGQWTRTDTGWTIMVASGPYTALVHPFTKVLKRFSCGSEESLVAFFDAVRNLDLVIASRVPNSGQRDV